MSNSAEKTTYTLAEAADLLTCHRETLRRAIRDGELKAAKLGREYRISRRDLEAFWTACGGGELFGSEGTGEASVSSPSAGKGASANTKDKRPQQRQLSLLDASERK